jgi:hypothetical protein
LLFGAEMIGNRPAEINNTAVVYRAASVHRRASAGGATRATLSPFVALVAIRQRVSIRAFAAICRTNADEECEGAHTRFPPAAQNARAGCEAPDQEIVTVVSGETVTQDFVLVLKGSTSLGPFRASGRGTRQPTTGSAVHG